MLDSVESLAVVDDNGFVLNLDGGRGLVLGTVTSRESQFKGFLVAELRSSLYACKFFNRSPGAIWVQEGWNFPIPFEEAPDYPSLGSAALKNITEHFGLI